MKSRGKWLPKLAALFMTLLLLLGQLAPWSTVPACAEPGTPTLTASEPLSSGAGLIARKKKAPPTPKPTATPRPTASPTPTPAPTEEGPITDPQAIADYLFAYGTLPENFITKKDAQALGWDSRYNYLSDVAPGMSIGGDRFGNYEGKLPVARGRQYYECDCNYFGGRRGAERIVFSNDGLVYYTADHYQTFTLMTPSPQETSAEGKGS